MKASIAGEGCGEEYEPFIEDVFASIFDADGKAGVLLETGGEQALELDVHAGFAEGGIAVVEQESAGERFVVVGDLVEQEGRCGGGVHGGGVAEEAEELEAKGLA